MPRLEADAISTIEEHVALYHSHYRRTSLPQPHQPTTTVSTSRYSQKGRERPPLRHRSNSLPDVWDYNGRRLKVSDEYFVLKNTVNDTMAPTSIQICVYRNGDEFTQAVKFVFSKHELLNWDHVLQNISNRVKLDAGATKRLFTLEGLPIKSGADLRHNDYYVAVGTDKFKNVAYGTVFKNPKLQQKSHANLTSTSSVNVKRTPAPAARSRAVGRGVKKTDSDSGYLSSHRSSAENSNFYAKGGGRSRVKASELDLDKDGSGVFRSTKVSRESRGAREVNDTRHTKSDVPVDLRRAEPVKDEVSSKHSRGRTDKKMGAEKTKQSQKSAGRNKAKEEAATKIQANFRGFKTRQGLKNEENKKLNNRVMTHSTSRERTGSSGTRPNTSEVNAATKIQAGFRGYKVRKEVAV